MRITHLLGMALLATTTLFTACKKDDPKPSFEDRKAEFQKAFAADPQHDAKMREMNTMIKNMFREIKQEDADSFKNAEDPYFHTLTTTKGFSLSDDEELQCRLYWCNLHIFAMTDPSSEERRTVTFDMLSKNSQDFLNSFSQQEMEELNARLYKWILRDQIETLNAADPNHELFVKGAEKYVQLAKEYGVEFTIDEAKQLLKETFETYYNSLKEYL